MTPSSLSRGQLVGLAVTLALGGALFVREAPPAPQPTRDPVEEAREARRLDRARRDAARWREDHGDRVVPQAERRGALALVIDDVGRDLDAFNELLSLRYRLTFSVLPRSSFAVGAQLRAVQDPRRPRELWLHLPCEPMDAAQMRAGAEREEDFLLRSDAEEGLRAKVRDALARVPLATGVNPHMGSALTTDAAAMRVIVDEVRRAGRAFIDSRTTAASVALREADSAGVPAAAREVFLDHERTQAAIEHELRRAAALALDHPVIAIGHPGPELYAVLARLLPELEAQGVAIVPASEVIRARTADQGAGSAAPSVEGSERDPAASPRPVAADDAP